MAFPGAKTALRLRRVDGEPHSALPGVISPEMPLEPRMPDDEEGRDVVLVGGRAPARGFGDEVPRHWSPPSDEARRTVVETMPRFIDDEPKAAGIVFVRGSADVAALFGGVAIAA